MTNHRQISNYIFQKIPTPYVGRFSDISDFEEYTTQSVLLDIDNCTNIEKFFLCKLNDYQRDIALLYDRERFTNISSNRQQNGIIGLTSVTTLYIAYSCIFTRNLSVNVFCKKMHMMRQCYDLIDKIDNFKNLNLQKTSSVITFPQTDSKIYFYGYSSDQHLLQDIRGFEKNIVWIDNFNMIQPNKYLSDYLYQMGMYKTILTSTI